MQESSFLLFYFKRRAQALLEFTLISIPFLILLFGIMQIAHIAIVKLIVNHACFMVTRVAIVDDRDISLVSAANSAIPFKDKQNISVITSYSKLSGEITVVLTYRMKLIFPVVSDLIRRYKKFDDYYYPIISTFSLPKENVYVS